MERYVQKNLNVHVKNKKVPKQFSKIFYWKKKVDIFSENSKKIFFAIQKKKEVGHGRPPRLFFFLKVTCFFGPLQPEKYFEVCCNRSLRLIFFFEKMMFLQPIADRKKNVFKVLWSSGLENPQNWIWLNFWRSLG